MLRQKSSGQVNPKLEDFKIVQKLKKFFNNVRVNLVLLNWRIITYLICQENRFGRVQTNLSFRSY
jgi:hypothetical protein